MLVEYFLLDFLRIILQYFFFMLHEDWVYF